MIASLRRDIGARCAHARVKMDRMLAARGDGQLTPSRAIRVRP
jgi:hypothetical protein